MIYIDFYVNIKLISKVMLNVHCDYDKTYMRIYIEVRNTV